MAPVDSRVSSGYESRSAAIRTGAVDVNRVAMYAKPTTRIALTTSTNG
jgi:hypothetical protein